jgi:YggT family protein
MNGDGTNWDVPQRRAGVAVSPKFRQKADGRVTKGRNLMNLIIDILRMLLDVVWWIIIVQAILSWLIAFNVLNTGNDFVRQIWVALDRMTQPLYRPIRRILPDFGGLDLSPLVVLVALSILDRVLVEIQFSYYVM